jgi:site-specific recombinase XerD
MSPTAHHPAVAAYLDALRAAGKASTARTYGHYLATFAAWASATGVDILRATTDQLAGYQLWLAQDRPARTGQVRARTTQATAIIVVQSFYDWLLRRNQIVHDPAAPLTPPSQPVNRMVRKDHLTLQEATALIQTQAAIVAEQTGPRDRAREQRNLALLSLMLATGRRVQGLTDLGVAQIDLERNELRVEREKGRTGRVLPVAAWAMATVRDYLAAARPILAEDCPDSPWLLVSQRAERLTTRAVSFLLRIAIQATIARNPDLTDLPRKRISTHSLRVSFATLLFQGGCGIRSINELMLHQTLSTTARYTPIPMADLRRALATTHLRA